ncbi:MAG: hypothetical protein AB1634_06540 [Thermodesulfobacteriota bacterium]
MNKTAMRTFTAVAAAVALTATAHGGMNAGGMSGGHDDMSGRQQGMSGQQATPAGSGMSGHTGMTAQHGMPEHDKAVEDSGPKATEIHTSETDGYKLSYGLIDMKKMEGSSMAGHDMSQMKSHHLVVSLRGPDGKPIEDATVGYLVTGPDGVEQKAMAMSMGGGYGADVDLSKKGVYTIKAKAVVGERKLMDELTYTVQ